MDATKILTQEEIQRVISDLHRRIRRKKSKCTWQNLIIFRLSCCCGLRVCEIVGLNIGDVSVAPPRPAIRVRKEITKGRRGKKRGRLVPLWWDRGTWDDLAAWKEHRLTQVGPDDPLVSYQQQGSRGGRLSLSSASARWKTALACLGPERVKQLSVHCGRHTFLSHALAVGRSLVEVRDAAGHASVATTSIYLHAVERPGVPDVFAFQEERK